MTPPAATPLKPTFHLALRHAWLFSRFILAGLALLYLLSGVFSVSQNEIGVHIRLGRIINGHVQPGIHYRLPWPFDSVAKVAVREVKRVVIDEFELSPAPKGEAKPPPDSFAAMTGLDAYCITGDNNLATVSCIIQYTVFNPSEYLFSHVDPEGMLKNLACKSILHGLAAMPIDDILTKGKQAVASTIQQKLQTELGQMKTGINICSVEIKNINPPARVAKYFSEVVKASIEREKSINEAQSYQNEVFSKAKAQAREQMEEAGGYKKEAILRAQGKTERFNQLLAQAGEKGSLTWKLLYAESMIEIMKNVGKKHIVQSNKDGRPAVNLKINTP